MTVDRGHRLEHLIGRLLQIGVAASALTVSLGAVIYLAGNGSGRPTYKSFHGESVGLTTFPGVLRGVAAFRGEAIIQLGLLMLIATPIVRVLFSLLAFLHEKDWLYTVFTAIVLAVLLYGFLSR